MNFNDLGTNLVPILLLALEVTALALAAWAGQFLTRSAHWRRLIWQTALIGLGCLLLVQATGLHRFLKAALIVPAPRSELTLVVSQSSLTLPVPSAEGNGGAAAGALPDTGGPGDVPGSTLAAKAATGFVLVWLGVSVLLLCYLGLARVRFAHRTGRLEQINDPELTGRIRELAGRVGMRRAVRIMEDPRLSGPVVFGWIRPTLSLPRGFRKNYDTGQQEAILAHELAHLVALDPFFQTLSHLLVTLLWWHPAVWWMRAQFHRASETAADEASLLVNKGPQILAECLVGLGTELAGRRSLAWLGVEGNHFRSGLGRRVTHLLQLNQGEWSPVRAIPRRLFSTVTVVALVGLGVGAAALISEAEAQPVSLSRSFEQSFAGRALRGILPASDTPRPMAALAAPAPPPSPMPAAPPAPPAPPPAPPVAPELKWEDKPAAVPPVAAPIPVVPAASTGPVAAPEAPAPATNDVLITRLFRIDAQTMMQQIREIRPLALMPGKEDELPADPSEALSQFLRSAGVGMAPPSSLHLNEQTGVLMARSTAADLALIEVAISFLNMRRDQLTLEVKLCEVEDSDAWGAEFLENVTTNAAGGGWTSILSEENYQAAIESLMQQEGVDLLTAPKITTLSDRPAQVKVVDVRYVVTDLQIRRDAGSPAPTLAATATPDGVLPADDAQLSIEPIAQPIEFGPVIDLIPHVLPDGETIQLTVIATITEFFGYDQREEFETYVRSVKEGEKQGEPVALRTPLPMFRKRQVSGSAIIKDGQSVLMHGGSVVNKQVTKTSVPVLGRIPLLGRLFRSQNEQVSRRHLMIFVTPTLIDPAGNRIHPSVAPGNPAPAGAPTRPW